MKRFVFCVLVVVAMVAPSVANALTCVSDCVFNYQFEFSGTVQQFDTNDQPIPNTVLAVKANLSGQLTTLNQPDLNAPDGAPTPSGAFGYDVLSISGTSKISGLSVPYSSSISGSKGLVPLGQLSFQYDNILYVPATGGSGYFDWEGVVFKDANSTFYNLSDNGFGDSLTIVYAGDMAGTLDLVNESVSPVPELSTWAMLLVGFVGLGFLAYRHRHRAVHSLV